ncbi:alpha/beta fold hydrolase [Streptomyces sp. NPDC057740]|uniref:alpha/beta fold hydrolase n=1 Tax=Streptomyces sp. NPDC057740 TaxID=3346234 RepID=UPI0036A6F892
MGKWNLSEPVLTPARAATARTLSFAVGGSQAVRCLTDKQRADAAGTAFDPAVPGGKPLPRLLTDTAVFTDGCVRHRSKEFLASLSTDNVARDIDQVRSALGEDKITYYGLSYGTVVGPMYATLFPHRVRQLVLDAPVDTDLWFGDSLTFLNDVAVASERTLNAWFKTCRAEGTAVCPFGARPAGGVRHTDRHAGSEAAEDGTRQGRPPGR